MTENGEEEREVARLLLRRRWELASVLNFLQVFEPVIGVKMKISAEEIETALIMPNGLLSQLHIALLKGIPPVSKTLNNSDAWVTALCKKVAMWWPWVAEGDMPLTTAKGEEIPRYKELDSVTRLLLLRALCEIRADQDDTVSYINDALKNGKEISSFRKDKIGGGESGTIYWLDGNTIIGHRLYKEVRKFEPMAISKGKGSKPAVISDWDTLATNFEEFQKVVDDFSASGSKQEVAVGKIIEADAIPVLDRLNKKKERALKQQQRQEMILNTFRDREIVRSSRMRRPVTYTFDEYDKAIDEALEVTKKRKTTEEQRTDEKHVDAGERKNNDPNGSSSPENDSGKSSVNTQESVASYSERELHVDCETDSDTDDAYNGDDSHSSGSEMAKNIRVNKNNARQDEKQAHKHFGSRWSSRLAGNANRIVLETEDIIARNRSRQRPTRNSTLKFIVVPDSEDEESSDNASDQISYSKKSPRVFSG